MKKLAETIVISLCVWAHLLQSCPTLCDSIDCSPPGSSVHGTLQARILKWVAMPLIAYGEWCQIHDLWSRRFNFSTRDQAWLLKSFYIADYSVQFSSVQFSRSVMSDSLWPHELQHARPPCPSPTHGVHPNSCPSRRWCHSAISSSVVPFSSCPQSLPASESFPMSQLFASGGQSIGVSALASVFPKNIQNWSPLGWTGWISLQSKGLSRVFSNTTVQKHQFFGAQLSSQSNFHIHTEPQEKP